MLWKRELLQKCGDLESIKGVTLPYAWTFPSAISKMFLKNCWGTFVSDIPEQNLYGACVFQDIFPKMELCKTFSQYKVQKFPKIFEC